MNAETFANAAAHLTYVFKRLRDGTFKGINNDIIEVTSFDELVDYFRQIANELLGKGEALLELPTFQYLAEEYAKRALDMATLSIDKSLDKYVDPITHEVLTASSDVQEFESKIQRNIHDYFNGKQYLPQLHDSPDEWKTFAQEKIKAYLNLVVDKSSSAPPTKKSKTYPPVNHTVRDNQQPIMENVIRCGQNIAHKLSWQIKDYDILKFRYYLCILRRLWILSQLHDGKEKGITRVGLDEAGKPIYHPYFKKVEGELYQRISENMEVHGICETEKVA